MSKGSVHFSSATDEWATPLPLFCALDNEFDFDLDVCATVSNRKTVRYYSAKEDGFSGGVDGLRQPWTGTCWCNPPYGRGIGAWTNRATLFRSSVTTVLLVPARTDTTWWLRLVRSASEVRFLSGRVTFVGGDNGAPFPSAIVVVGGARKPLSVGWFSLDAGAIIRQV